MSAGGVLYYTADSKTMGRFIGGFHQFNFGPEHPYLLPPVGWYQSADWVAGSIRTQLKEALATPAVDTTRSNRLSLVLAGIFRDYQNQNS